MKHNIKITAILLIMFFIAQLIGLFVIKAYMPKDVALPFGFEPPEEIKPGWGVLGNILFAMVIAVALVFLFMKLKIALFLRFWFFFVVLIALAITFNSLIIKLPYASYISLIIALPLAFIKVFRRNFLVHNITELLIYPGLAAVFVPILNLQGIILLLIIISAYDIYAVWHSGFMQKMAKYQINEVKVFAGFFVPYLGKKERDELKKIKNTKFEKKKMKKIKVNLAILGGGDVIFPMIAAGVVFASFGIVSALIVSLFAALSLLYLFVVAEKGKFYPAMPFLTAGIFIGIAAGYLIRALI